MIETEQVKLDLTGFHIIYFPKRKLEIPLVATKNPEDQKLVDMMSDYFKKDPTYISGDSEEFYTKNPRMKPNNQFRGNSMASVIGAMQLLARRYCVTGDQLVGQKLYDISINTLDKISGKKGKPYNKMQQPYEKLEVVHTVEDNIIKALNLLKGN